MRPAYKNRVVAIGFISRQGYMSMHVLFIVNAHKFELSSFLYRRSSLSTQKELTCPHTPVCCPTIKAATFQWALAQAFLSSNM